MPITILPPAPPPHMSAEDSDDEDYEYDSEGDVEMEDVKPVRQKLRGSKHVVTPGELVTDDSQWMRGHGTYLTPDSSAIHSSIFGTILKTNKRIE